MRVTSSVHRTRAAAFAFAICSLFLSAVGSGADADQWNPDETFASKTKVISLEGGLGHFGDRLPGGVQEWNLGARFSLLPFDVFHLKGAAGVLDGSLEIGLEPVFERFNTERQNFGGVVAEARYYLLGLRFKRVVPWIAGSIGPGGSDLNIGNVEQNDRLEGPFLARITGEVGFAYFVEDTTGVYVGLQGTHFSNGGLIHGTDHNFSLNTPWAGVLGISWYIY